MLMRYAEIKYPDIANGPGVRVSLFLQGCSRHCKGCFNQSTWDHHRGKEFDQAAKEEIFYHLGLPWVKGLSVLGGEPLEQADELADFLREVKERFPYINIWMWTGFWYEDVKDLPALNYVDVLVDGPFIEEQKNLCLKFRGSENQRILNLKEGKHYE